MLNSKQKQLENISIDDSILLNQARQGNSKALEHLVKKYQDRIYNVILKISHNPDDALELTQDTFVKVIENIDSFRGHSTFYTWLFRVGVNLTLNYCRRKNTFRQYSLDTATDDAKRSVKDFLEDSDQESPSEIVQKKEVIELLNGAIAMLDEKYRAVIVLRDIEQMSYAEIADVLGSEMGTVKSRLSRARAALREVLERVLKNVNDD